MDAKEIKALIERYRAQCLIHRYLYYVKAQPLISDLEYDRREKKLEELVQANPEIAMQAEWFSFCPTRVIGSSNIEDYPRHLEMIADSLLANKDKFIDTPQT